MPSSSKHPSVKLQARSFCALTTGNGEQSDGSCRLIEAQLTSTPISSSLLFFVNDTISISLEGPDDDRAVLLSKAKAIIRCWMLDAASGCRMQSPLSTASFRLCCHLPPGLLTPKPYLAQDPPLQVPRHRCQGSRALFLSPTRRTPSPALFLPESCVLRSS